MIAVRSIPITAISIPPRVRRPLALRVEALAASIAVHGQDTPIEVVATESGYELITGGHRLAALKRLKRETIDARVFEAGLLTTEHQRRLREIRENFERFELNALERAVSIAAWRESYEAINGAVARGGDRRSKQAKAPSPDQSVTMTLCTADELSAEFARKFSDAAQDVFGLSHKGVYRALQIARIAPNIRDRLADLPIAEKQSELLNFAQAPTEQHGAICDLLAESDEPLTVAEALAILNGTSKPRPMLDWEKASAHFSRLAPRDQDRFFTAHLDAIEIWQAKRASKRGK